MCWVIRPVPALTGGVEGNLWEQRLRDKVALVDPRRAITKAVLPFPDPVLSLIPLRAQRTSRQHASILAMWMFGIAGGVALVNSAWQNTLLVRQVTDDLRRYAPLLAVESQLQRTSLGDRKPRPSSVKPRIAWTLITDMASPCRWAWGCIAVPLCVSRCWRFFPIAGCRPGP